MPNPRQRTSASHDRLINLLMIGDSKVGKSSILLQWADSKFEPSFITTIGIDFRAKILKIDDENVKVYVWDTAGQERFRTITMAYYRNAMGVLLVYDVTDRETFDNVRHWLKNIENNASEDIAIILIGNKTDKESQRVISYDEGSAMAKEISCPFFETSALTGSNIEEAFKCISKHCKDRLLSEEEDLVKLTGRVSITGQHGTSQKCTQCSGMNPGGVVDKLPEGLFGRIKR